MTLFGRTLESLKKILDMKNWTDFFEFYGSSNSERDFPPISGLVDEELQTLYTIIAALYDIELRIGDLNF